MIAGELDNRRAVNSRMSLVSILLCSFSLWFFTVLINWPGHYSFDSIVQLAEGMTGYYISSHSPLMSQILGWVTRIGGHGVFIVINSFLFFLSQGLILLKFKNLGKQSALMIVFLIAMSLNPMVLIYNGTVWKDVFCANLLLLSFVIIWFFDKARLHGVVAGLGLAVVASMVRQQGALVAIVIMVYAAWEVRRPGTPTQSGFVRAVVLCAVCMLLFFSAISAAVISGQKELDESGMSAGLVVAAGFDVAGMIVNSTAPEVVLSRYISNAAEAVTLARQSYTPARVDTLSPFLNSIAQVSGKNMYKLWLDLALNEPSSLLMHKLKAATVLFGGNESARCLTVHVGVADEALDFLQDSGYPYYFPEGFLPEQSTFSGKLYAYAKSMPYLFTGWIWIVALIVVFFLGLFRKLLFVQVLAVGGLVYVGSFMLIGIACDFRYLYFGTLASATGMLVLVGHALEHSGRRKA